MAMFWPEKDEERARASLRQTLSFLRKCLGPEILTGRGRGELGLTGEGSWCDALAFDALVKEGRPREALDLYRGDFLDGFHFNGCRPFQEWLEARRVEARETASQAAWQVARDAEKREEPEEAAHWGKKALSLSPFSETEVQRLMGLLDRIGDRAGALRAYRGLSEMLARDFGAVPSPETEALMMRVRDRVPPEAKQSIAGKAPVDTRRLWGGRRTGSERRRVQIIMYGKDQRSGHDRRSGEERREGSDRRGP